MENNDYVEKRSHRGIVVLLVILVGVSLVTIIMNFFNDEEKNELQNDNEQKETVKEEKKLNINSYEVESALSLIFGENMYSEEGFTDDEATIHLLIVEDYYNTRIKASNLSTSAISEIVKLSLNSGDYSDCTDDILNHLLEKNIVDEDGYRTCDDLILVEEEIVKEKVENIFGDNLSVIPTINSNIDDYDSGIYLYAKEKMYVLLSSELRLDIPDIVVSSAIKEANTNSLVITIKEISDDITKTNREYKYIFRNNSDGDYYFYGVEKI